MSFKAPPTPSKPLPPSPDLILPTVAIRNNNISTRDPSKAMKTFAAILSASAACIVCVRSAPLVGGLSSRGDYHVSELNTALVAGSKEATNSYVMDDAGEEKTHVVERDSTGVQNGYHVSELNTALVAASKDEANSYMMDDAGEDDAW